MSIRSHDTEPVHGLPEKLPKGETILWQGGPALWPLARRLCKIHWVGGYFALLLGWQIAAGISDGHAAGVILAEIAGSLVMAVAACGVLLGLAWLVRKTTIYTITDRRVVLRIGVALQMAINLPFSRVQGAALRSYRDGSGDIPLQLEEDTRLGYAHLWPHARPWRMRHCEPMLRSVPDAARVAETLAQALANARPDLASSSAAQNTSASQTDTVTQTPDAAVAVATVAVAAE